jgi:hypothetical protein
METHKQVGTVLDGATPLNFPFKVAKETDIPLHEYVTVSVSGRMRVRYCEVCGCEIDEDEYESFDGMCWECWDDQMAEESEDMFGDVM